MPWGHLRNQQGADHRSLKGVKMSTPFEKSSWDHTSRRASSGISSLRFTPLCSASHISELTGSGHDHVTLFSLLIDQSMCYFCAKLSKIIFFSLFLQWQAARQVTVCQPTFDLGWEQIVQRLDLSWSVHAVWAEDWLIHCIKPLRCWRVLLLFLLWLP